VKKLALILLLAVGMTLSFAAIGLVMLFATGAVKSPEDVRAILTGEVPGEDPSADAKGVDTVQDALILLQQQKQEMQSDLLKLKEEQGRLEAMKQTLSEEIGVLEQQGQTGQQDQVTMRADRLAQLVVLYDAMRPADAATIMDQMSDEMILEILPKLKERQAARILNTLTDDKRKAELSAQLLAGQPRTATPAQTR